MSIVIPAPPNDLDLAWAKAAHGMDLTTYHRQLVALEIARRAHMASLTVPPCGDELRILHTLVAFGSDVDARFAYLVECYGDWAAVEENVDAWRFQVDQPMTREAATEWVLERLHEALSELVTVPTAVPSAVAS